MKGHKTAVKYFSKISVNALRIKDSAWYITWTVDNFQYTVFSYHNLIRNGDEFSVDVDQFAMRSYYQFFTPIVDRVVFKKCRFIFSEFCPEFEEYSYNVDWKEL